MYRERGSTSSIFNDSSPRDASSTGNAARGAGIMDTIVRGQDRKGGSSYTHFKGPCDKGSATDALRNVVNWASPTRICSDGGGGRACLPDCGCGSATLDDEVALALAGMGDGGLNHDGRDTAGDDICLRGWRVHDFHGDGRRLGGVLGSATEPGKVVRSGRRKINAGGEKGQRELPC